MGNDLDARVRLLEISYAAHSEKCEVMHSILWACISLSITTLLALVGFFAIKVFHL